MARHVESATEPDPTWEEAAAEFEAGEPGEQLGVDLDAVLPVNLGRLTLQPGVYTWIAEIDGKEAASTDFVVRAEP